MTDNFERALPFILRFEGGWSDHPADKGGPTACGITLQAYRDYKSDQTITAEDLKVITPGEVADIYRLRYWRKTPAPHLPWPVCLVVFDAAVNSGPARSIRWLQEAVGTPADGTWGQASWDAYRQAEANDGPRAIALAALDHREKFLRAIGVGSQAVFLRGWLNRVNDLREEVGR